VTSRSRPSVAMDPYGVCSSTAMRDLLRQATRVAEVNTSVLIMGESGVGKECLARFIHDRSPRSARPFVPVNCGALPEALFESELFGHARGAFTGALQDRPGLFEAASGGTILLDEIGDVPLHLQVKLLRALQERETRRVGENRQRRFDARIIAATNRDLAHDVNDRRFRGDLYYRLRIVELVIPPLRERRQDIPGLAEEILTRIAARLHRRVTGFSPGALDCLTSYSWPGNIRELENTIERICALSADDVLDIEDLPREIRGYRELPTAARFVHPLRDVERQYVLAVLDQNGGNRTLTAQQLQIGAATLYRKLRKYAQRP
jgi:two-component system, NtrC family, response regulator HydG